MVKKKKLYTGLQSIGGNPVKSLRVARQITSTYHTIQNKLFEIKQNRSIFDLENRVHINELESKLSGMAKKYQESSIITTKFFKTSRWVVQQLVKLGLDKSDEKINTLEVGAINTQLQQCPRLNVRSIDLSARCAGIEEIDFFNIEPLQSYDVVVCSMVINCVPDPERRGEMIARLAMHIKPMTGVLFLMLPVRCITSPQVGSDNFEKLLNGFGLESKIQPRFTPKVVFYVLQNQKSTQIIDTIKEKVDKKDKWIAVIKPCIRQNMGTNVLNHFQSKCISTIAASNQQTTISEISYSSTSSKNFVITIPNFLICEG